jgi:hypothetical protein
MSLWTVTDNQAGKPKSSTRKVVFDATTAVNLGTDIITLRGHNFANLTPVIYTKSGTNAIGNLTDGTTYYTIRVTSDTLKLASSMANAIAGTAIDLNSLTSVGTTDSLIEKAVDVYFVDSTEVSAGGDNIVEITVGNPGSKYFEVPTATYITPNLSTVVIAGTAGQFTCASGTLSVGDRIIISGTFGGTGSITGYASGKAYKVTSVTGNTPTVTGFTLINDDGSPLVTTAGTPTGLTYGAGTGLAATVAVANGGVSSITVSNVGSGYGQPPMVTIAPAKLTVATTGVDSTTTRAQITYNGHTLTAGTQLLYRDGGGAAATGLTTSTNYFVSALGLAANTFRLATTAALATTANPLTTLVITDTAGAFTCANATLAVGDRVQITGTWGGTGSITGYASGNIYRVSAVTGTSPNVTGFTLQTEAAGAIVTTTGTPTGITAAGYSMVNITGTGNNAQFFTPNVIPMPTANVDSTTTRSVFTSTGSNLVAGAKLIYDNGGGTSITGLLNAYPYYVSALGLTANAFRLAPTAFAATTGNPIQNLVVAGTGGQFTCSASTIAVGDRVQITGTNTGTGAISGYSTGNVYRVSAVTGSSPNVTGFTLTTEAAGALTTTAGTVVGWAATGWNVMHVTGTGDARQIFIPVNSGVATASAVQGSVSAITHSGWVKRTVGTGGRAGRVFYETLVATGTASGTSSDAADDLQLPD